MSRATPGWTRWIVAIAATAGVTTAWLLLPDAPNYDTASHMVWARDLLKGQRPQVSTPSAPTLHPLWLAVCAVAVATGAGAPLLQLLTLACFVLVCVFVYVLADGLAGRIAGAATVLFCGSSFALWLLAFKAYGDLPFLALVTGALALEARRRQVPCDGSRHRGLADALVPGLFFVAGLLRPEAWALGLLLISLRAREGVRLAHLVLWGCVVLAAPALWMTVDLWLSGDALRSLTGTRELAAKLDRTTGLSAAPRQAILLTADLVRPPVAVLGVVGVALAARRRSQPQVAVPLVTLAAGLAGFLLVGAAGLPLLQRYIQLPALMLCVFAGATVGWSIALIGAEHGSRAARRIAAAGLAAGVVLVGGYAATKVRSVSALVAGVLREATLHRQGAEMVSSPEVRLWLTCGPITLPSYRFVPELTVAGALPTGVVVSRAQTFGGTGTQTGGIAIVIAGTRAAKRRLAWAPGVSRTSNRPPSGFRVVARRGPFVAYGRCTGGRPDGLSR